MKSRKQDFVLGLAAIVFIALFVGTILFLYPRMSGGTHSIVVNFRHDDGLAPLKTGSPVMLSGALQVGTVTSVAAEELTVETPQGSRKHLMIVVEADVSNDLQLYGGCQITTDQPPVGGSGMMVILDVGTPGKELKQPIAGLPPQSLGAAIGALSRRLLAPEGIIAQLERMIDADADGSLMNKVMLSLTDIQGMTHDLRTQMNAADQKTLMTKIHRVMDDLNATTAALRAQTVADEGGTMMAKVHIVLDHLSTGLAEAVAMLQENRPVVRSTLVHVDRAAQKLDEELIAAMRAELDRENPASMLGKLHAAMDAVNVSLANLQTMSATGRNMLTVNRPLLDRTLANVKDMSEQLRLASQEIRLAPWRLLYKPTPRESDEMSIFEAARTFAEAATYLDDAAARLEAAVAAAPPGGPTLESDEELRAIRESLKAAFERFGRAEQVLWEKMK